MYSWSEMNLFDSLWIFKYKEELWITNTLLAGSLQLISRWILKKISSFSGEITSISRCLGYTILIWSKFRCVSLFVSFSITTQVRFVNLFNFSSGDRRQMTGTALELNNGGDSNHLTFEASGELVLLALKIFRELLEGVLSDPKP